MSEVQTVIERSFRREGVLSPLSAAAYWAATHPEVDIDTIVGDDEFVYLYYTEQGVKGLELEPQPRVYGPADDFEVGRFTGASSLSGYTLKGRAT